MNSHWNSSTTKSISISAVQNIEAKGYYTYSDEKDQGWTIYA